MDKLITILTVNYNTADFINTVLYSLEKLTKNTYRVYILDNGSPLSDYNKLKKYVKKYKNIHIERRKIQLTGSQAHGDGLNYLFNKINTKYFCIIDPDAIWLQKNWDQTLINLIDNKTKIIGTQAPVGSKKYQDFPVVFAAFFESETFKRLNINCMPQDTIGKKDVCYELKDKYRNAGFDGKIIEMKNTRTYKKGPFNKILCAEYYLNNDYNRIFASHFSRGSTGGSNKYTRLGLRKYFYKIPILGKIALYRRGQNEKKYWIQTVKKIVDRESKS